MFDDRSPIYHQIAEAIKNDILSGQLGADDQVMSTNQYAAFYRINPATAAKGFAQLVDEGVIYKRRGIGMFVSPDARERLLKERRERFFAEVVDPIVDEARVIGVPLTEIVARIQAYAGDANGGRRTGGDEQAGDDPVMRPDRGEEAGRHDTRH
ncbi:GntR family transcriptional regulator [Phytoactinopolyspora alkaliphila]|uniref:GntR family transcriptional regulator n=1 Tax=Phytoactinopolyspora alkaliphila TaxID=1783498 RepID=A0A6N9YTH5_9ACTN|nr:GntR family transcriptional regulator [Phytoactinopolyspora alkaliphila]NED98353.1 GntR family transcriptional regulator [Phytoactinopolyspora alkaliphila]